MFLIYIFLLINTIFCQHNSAQNINNAKYVFEGTYDEHLSPCIPRNNGQSVRYKQFGFKVEKILKGNIKADYIGINDLTQDTNKPYQLKPNYKYLILINPDEKLTKVIETGEGCYYYFNTLQQSEIIEIIEISLGSTY